MDDHEHRARFSQGTPVGEMPPTPSILTVNDVMDHSRLIAQTSRQHYEDFDLVSDSYFFSTYGRYDQSQLIRMKERLAMELGVKNG